MNNIVVRYRDLPTTIKAYVVRCFDSGDIFYTIIINSRISYEQQREAYKHEMSHIECGDFSCEYPADYIESMRHYS